MAGRGAPNKKGLEYFPKMINFYDDDKIFDLMDEYGPLGVTIYDVILTIVYDNGYYAELSKDKLSRMIIRKIGNKWIKGQKVVVQVVDYCAELGLLSKDLLQQNIITSEGIQKRYHKIAVKLMKRQLYSDKYWLLKKEEELLLNAPKNPNNSEENGINSEEIQDNSEFIDIKEKETKVKNKNTVFSPLLEKKFQVYLIVRASKHGEASEYEIQSMRESLVELSTDETEQIGIVNRATVGKWKHFYKTGTKNASQPVSKKQVKKDMNNFERRKYDMDNLEEQLLKSVDRNFI